MVMTKIPTTAASIVLLLFSTWNLKSELFVRKQWKSQLKQQKEQQRLASKNGDTGGDNISSNGGNIIGDNDNDDVNGRPFISFNDDVNKGNNPPPPPPPAEEKVDEVNEEPVNTQQEQPLRQEVPAPAPAPAPEPPKPAPKTSSPSSSSSIISFQHKYRVLKNPEKQGIMSNECKKASPENPCLVETQYTYGKFSPMDYGYYTNKKQGGDAVFNPAKPYLSAEAADGDVNNKYIWPAKDQTHAVCVLMELGGKNKQGGPKGWQLLDDTPHHLQELYRCINWWLSANPSQKPVLVTPAQPDPPKQSQYVKTFYKLLQEVLGVDIHYGGNMPEGQKHVSMGAPLGHFSKQINGYVINADAADTFRTKLLNHLYKNNTRQEEENQKREAGCSAGKKPKIWLVNREGSRRILQNHQEILQELQAAFPISEGYEPIQYQSSFSVFSTPEEQMKFMSQADIVVGPHGQQFMSVAMMPKCGGLVEFFGRGYHMPNFFGSLAAATGHYHYFTYDGGDSGMTSLKTGRIQKYHKVSSSHAVELVKNAVESWSTCCQNGFRSG